MTTRVISRGLIAASLLLSFQSPVAAQWEAIERKDAMTDAVTLQGYSGEATEIGSSKVGVLFLDCGATVPGFEAHAMAFTFHTPFFYFADDDTAMMRVDDNEPISNNGGAIRSKPYRNNTTTMMFLDATDSRAQKFIGDARKGNSLAVRVRSDRGKSTTFKFSLGGSNNVFGKVLESCGLPEGYPDGYES